MTEAALLTTALLFGGMTLYSFGFAAFLFNALGPQDAGPLIRRAFPHFYLFVFISATIAAALSLSSHTLSAALLAAIAVTTIFARQVLMPAINRATDAGAQTRFKWLHGASVIVSLAHIFAAGAVIVMLARQV